VADPLVEAIKDRLPKVKVGPGSDPTAEMGPLVTKQHRDKVATYLDSSAEQGATVVADGRQHPLYDESDGFFLGVSLIDHVTPAMDAYRDEIFGPVLTVMRVKTMRKRSLINDNPYGNGIHLHPRRRAARQLVQTLMVINVDPVPVAYYSFGGWKNSLFGDLHVRPRGVQFPYAARS
jgi:malonate-semialdehyde dehydrogenase (acetylating)/methylmalonate-semialdehyde dehydrogenase